VSRAGDPIRILGVDPGSRHTGYGVIEKRGARLVPVDAGSLSPSPRLSFSHRLLEIHDGLAGVIRTHRPLHVAMEDIFHAVNVRSALKLAQVRGVLLLAAAEAGLEVAAYPPRSVKKAVVGTGGADKSQVAWMIVRLLGLGEERRPADVTDALAVAVCHALHLGPEGARTEAGTLAGAAPGARPVEEGS
jgi:crossover junction endodeoxyribonuclease RuvC